MKTVVEIGAGHIPGPRFEDARIHYAVDVDAIVLERFKRLGSQQTVTLH